MSRLSPVHVSVIVAFVILWTSPAVAQKSAGPANGTLIVDGGGTTEPVVRRFVELAGGPQARIVVIATAPSSIRFGADNVILDPDWPRDRVEWRQYHEYLKRWLGVDNIEIIHTRDRRALDTEAFVAPLNSATGVYLAPGNSGRLADAYLGTRTLTALKKLLDRGGVIFWQFCGRNYSGLVYGAGTSGQTVTNGARKNDGLWLSHECSNQSTFDFC